MKIGQCGFKRLAVAVLMVVSSISFAEDEKKMEKMDPALQEAASYSLGARYAQAIEQDFGDELNMDKLVEGFSAVLKGEKLSMTPEEMQANLLQLQQIRTNRLQQEQAVLGEKNQTASTEFMDKNKDAEGVKVTDSGLQYKVLKSGKGDSPKKSDKVTVHYHGKLVDGTVFDSSIERGTPASFPVGGVIPGWTEALQLMVPGDKWVLYVPAKLAYGERGTPGGPIGPNQALIFEVELISIDK